MDEKTFEFVNQAAREDLIAVPGIGEALADRIIAARPFASLNDCAERVRGVSLATLEKVAQYLESNVVADTPSSDEAAVMDEEPVSAAAAAADEAPSAPTDDTPDEWKQRFDAMKAQFETQLESQSRQARERFDQLADELQRKSKRQVTMGALIWSNLITLALALVLMAAFWGVANARLQRDMSASLDVAAQRMETLQTDLTTLQSRVDALEGIGARTAALEAAQQDLQDSFTQVQADVQAVQSDVATVQAALDEQAQKTQRFDDFLQGLQGLLNQLLTQPLGGAQ